MEKEKEIIEDYTPDAAFLCKAKILEGKDKGSWIVGYYWRDTEGRNYIISENTSYEIDYNTLCRCMGLKDIKGNYIFDKDYIKDYSFSKGDPLWSMRYVCDRNSTLGMQPSWYLERDDFTSFMEFECGDEETYCYEVIGNVNDNPKLEVVRKKGD